MIESPLNLRTEAAPVLAAPGAWTQAETVAVEPAVTVQAVSVRETVSTVHRAVEAVLTAADSRAQDARSSVDLQFSVGDAALSVRVELRDREVHATFLTDSADLRSALTQEWHSAAVEVADRPVRFSAPVVTTGHGQSESFTATGGETPAGHEHGQRAPERPGYASVPFFPGRSSASESEGPRATASAPRALPTSVHLHTLA